MAQTSFDIDSMSSEALEELKKKFGVKTNAAAIRKALALALVAVQNSTSDNTVTIVDKDDNKKIILLTG